MDQLSGAGHNHRYGVFGHPGYAWAARRSAINGLGGLMDWPILGAADHHMAWAFVGDVRQSHAGGLAPSYLARLLRFEALAAKVVDTNVGYVPGTILHSWHGNKKNRFYQERWSILQRYPVPPEGLTNFD